MYKYVDYFESYGRIMQFNKNKTEPIHRWYPFVEGYSKEFIKSIIDEQENITKCCLEPFSGSGTTALELQNMGIKCISFEINPFMYLIAKVKLENEYDIDKCLSYFRRIKHSRCQFKNIELTKEFSTLYQNNNIKKWNYNIEVGVAVEKIKLAISTIKEEKYNDLFTVVLASILLDVSNLYRNGKCLSYKKNWKDNELSEKEVFAIFDRKFNEIFLPDLMHIQKKKTICNKLFLINGDSRIAIEEFVENNSVDLIITAPPYLNSRDYTDTYMLELKTLGLTRNLNEISELRKKTLRSHVQIKWSDKTNIKIEKLEKLLHELSESEQTFESWNTSIIDMIRLYFVDINRLFEELYHKLKIGGKIYFNVSNSAYFNILVNSIEIICDIAENIGFHVLEIRKARWLKSSPQQKEKIEKLLEAVIVIEK